MFGAILDHVIVLGEHHLRRMVAAWAYESYAEALASRGMVVIVRGACGPGTDHCDLARDASRLADFLVRDARVPPSWLGVAGHSFGAKAAVLAAARDDRFRAVAALDPDDSGEPSAVELAVGRLEARLLLVGAEVAWKASSACAPKEHNYQRFFERAQAGTIERTLVGADHVQLLDDARSPLYSICRVGTADSFAVRTAARRAVVGFFLEQLAGASTPHPRRPGDHHARARGGCVLSRRASGLEPTRVPVTDASHGERHVRAVLEAEVLDAAVHVVITRFMSLGGTPTPTVTCRLRRTFAPRRLAIPRPSGCSRRFWLSSRS